MWITLISSGWFIMDLRILQMNKTTAVSIWRLVANFPLLNTALFRLTAQSRPANTEPLWDDLPHKLSTSKMVKKSKYTHPVHSSITPFYPVFIETRISGHVCFLWTFLSFNTARWQSLQHPVNKSINQLYLHLNCLTEIHGFSASLNHSR